MPNELETFLTKKPTESTIRYNRKKLRKKFLKRTLKNNLAFTLAEVLIVLGIIGVVAALTIPTLISSYQKTQTITQLKKAYTTISQAIRKSESENGPNDTWDWGTGITPRQSFDTYWAPYLKVMKYCSSYSDCGYSSSTPWRQLNGNTTWTVDVVEPLKTSVILADGSFIWVRDDADVAIDINAFKGPNILGKDVFHFTVVSPKGFVPRYYQFNTNQDCFAGDVGDYCANKIMRDGWQIKDDYPWN